MILLSRNNYNEVFPAGDLLVARRDPDPTTDRGLAIPRSKTRANSPQQIRLMSLSNMHMSCPCLPMADLDVFTISVASTLSGRALSRVITGPVKGYDMNNTVQKLDLLYHSTQKSTCSSRRLHDHNLA